MNARSTIFKIGLTGGIASGKTSVTRLFDELGVPIVDADVVAREVVAPGTPGLAALVAQLDDNILDENGELDRSALRKIIFDHPDVRKRVESILHPAIRLRSNELVNQSSERGDPYVVCAVPLLVEGGLVDQYDRIAVVDVSEETQIKRIVQRDNISRDDAIKILDSQATRYQRLAVADDVIDNDGTSDKLKQQIGSLHKRYTEMAVTHLNQG